MKTNNFCKRTVSLLLCLMMVISMFAIGMVSTAAAGSITVYFTRPDSSTGWNQSYVNIYFTTSSGQNQSASWPGNAMSFDHNNSFGQSVYKATIPSDTNLIVFNDRSGKQTVDITTNIKNNVQFYTTGQYDGSKMKVDSTGGEDPTEPTTVEPTTEAPTEPAGDTIRIYFTNNKGWTAVNCYSFKNAQPHYTVWPGNAMTYYKDNSQGQKVYYADIPADSDGVVFNNNNNGMQTLDVTIDGTPALQAGYGYYCDGDNSPFPVKSWAEDTKTYKLVFAGEEEAITSGAPVKKGLTEGETYTFAINEYNDATLTATYGADDVAGANFDVTLTKGASALTFTPDTTAEYSIVFDSSKMSLKASVSGSKRFYIQDDTSNKFMADQDAKLFIIASDVKYPMTKSIDTLTGLTTWYADIPDTISSFTFQRTNFFGDTNWNAYNVTVQSGKDTYKATSGNAGAWQTQSANVATGTVDNFWAGIYCDTKGNGDVADFVKAYANGDTYTLYLPSYTDLTNAKIYSTYNYAKITGPNYTSGKEIYSNNAGSVPTAIENTLRLEKGTYSLEYKYRADGSVYTGKTLKIMKTENTAALLMKTENEFFTGTTSDYADSRVSEYKEGIVTKGTYAMYSESGSLIVGDNNKIKKIKGRGNSSFEASMKLYGKYAYNLNLDKKAGLVDGANKAKKWCLLANTMDESMVRNSLIFSIANDIGVLYAPKTRLVDLYDNGKYLGAYVIAEKVEYGSDTMMANGTNGKVVSLDKYNETFATEHGLDYADIEDGVYAHTGTFTPAGSTHTYQYKYNDYGTSMEDGFKTGDYVMEFELSERYQAEASWFVEPTTGQAVCMKYPEFASQDEMQWFITEFDKMWTAAYSTNYTAFAQQCDVSSFVKTYLIQELSANLDSAATSYYVTGGAHFDKLVAAPVWDYDWTCGDFWKTKPVYTGSSSSLDNPNQMFVKNKSMNTGNGDHSTSTPCFEAQLCKMADFWTECQKEWTNEFVTVLDKYVYNKYITGSTPENSKLLSDFLPAFKTSVEMNEDRWKSLSNFKAKDWGSKSTAKYNKDSWNFNVGNDSVGSATLSYDNTVYYLNDWLAARWNYMSGDGDLWDDDEKYVITDAEFSISPDLEDIYTTTRTITPDVRITKGNEVVSDDLIQYTVYINGKAKGTYNLADNPTLEYTFDAGTTEIYLEVAPVEMPELKEKTDTKKVVIEAHGGEVDLDVYFKSSDSLRYLPSVTVGGTETVMTKDSFIAKNQSQTQTFSWYKATVKATLGEKLTLTFTNAYAMHATVTVAQVGYKPYYFGADNLNNATTAYDYTSNNATEVQKNFVRSATNLVYNGEGEIAYSSLAYTSLGGTQYVLGDTDGDNNLSVMDATLMQKQLAQLTSLDDTRLQLADFNLDSDLSIMDVTRVQRNLAKVY